MQSDRHLNQQSDKVNVLLVDDHPENLLALEAILDGLGQNLVKAYSGEEALRCLLHQDFAVILLDVQMPGMDGFETATLIRQRERSRNTPIIFLTAFSSSDSLVFKGYSLGAVDYLLKPIEPEILLSKVSAFVELFQKTAEIQRQAAQLKSINAELKISEERFRSLSACSPLGIFMTDIEGYCTYTNPSCQAIAGFTLEESLGPGWLQAVHPEDQIQVLADWSDCVRRRGAYSGESRFQWRDGTVRWVHIRSSPMRSDQGELIGYVGTVEDITERKQAEAARAQFLHEQIARQQAEAANRMKDEFLGTLSHELRTPLNAMLGWVRLLRTKKFDEAMTARALETIERNAKSQAQLIEDILDVSRIITGKVRLLLRPTNLVSLIEATIDAVRLTADAKSIQLITVLDPAVNPVCVDSDRFQQVLLNLLSNAIKFTNEGGKVEIHLENIDSSVQIKVTDTGIGISSDFLPYVFERFRQADSTTTRPHSGLGLGLAIVRHIVELHGGTVSADSAGLGLGAVFSVTLPATSKTEGNGMKLRPVPLPVLKAEGQAASVKRLTRASIYNSSNNTSDVTATETQRQASLVENQPQVHTSEDRDYRTLLAGVQLLVVDDELDARELLKFVLQEHGAQVTAASSVKEAIALLQEIQPDVLISDIGMPEEDGYNLIQKVRHLENEQVARVPAIALTAYAREEERLRALSAGFNQHLPKPLDATALVTLVISLLKGDK